MNTASALSPPPPLPVDALSDFYHAMDGDQWHRNDGWLDPEVDVCDWYGITCVTMHQQFGGMWWIGRIRLANNNLHGDIADIQGLLLNHEPVTVPTIELDLSNNSISGTLLALPTKTQVINLSGNRLTGPLPAFPDDTQSPGDLNELDLSGNELEGSVPANWGTHLSFRLLDLSNNQLKGSIEQALRAMQPEIDPGPQISNTGLWLADNAFSGELDPEWFVDRELSTINLCWTDVEITDPALEAWIAERHWGGDHRQCLGRERLALDPGISGSWYDIHRPGEGFSLMLLEDGTPLIYWFSHISKNRQLWLFNSALNHRTTTAHARPAFRTRGEFDLGFAGLDQAMFRGGELRLDRVGSARLHAEFRISYTGHDVVQPGELHITFPPQPDTGFRSDQHQLTRLAGTSCDNQLDQQWISGAWYSPGRGGEGFVVEVNEDGRGIVYWFSYTPAGTNVHPVQSQSGDWQTWMTGDGQFEGNSLIIDNLLHPRDTAFGMPGDASGIENQPWGSLRMDFHDELSGQIFFDSEVDGYGSGSYAIERLARPLLAECED